MTCKIDHFFNQVLPPFAGDWTNLTRGLALNALSSCKRLFTVPDNQVTILLTWRKQLPPVFRQ